MVVALLQLIPVPHPIVYGPNNAAEHILDGPEHKQFYTTRGYGYLCAKSLDVSQLLERASALPERLQNSFYSGAALTFNHPDPAQVIADIRRLLPTRSQHLLIEGLNRYDDEPCLFLGDKVASYKDVRESASQMSQALKSAPKSILLGSVPRSKR